MPGPKTNERPGTRASARNVRMSATKARAVLDNIRGLPVDEARAVLAYTDRAAAEVVGKCMESAVANAEHNDEIDPETLYVSACYADEGRTMYRWRPRARGRATRIRKRTCHITIIVSTMPAEMLAIEQAKREAIPGSRAARRRGQEAASRAARVAASQEADEADELDETTEALADEAVEADAEAKVDEAAEETTDTEEDASAEGDAAKAPAEAAAADEDSSVQTGTSEERSDEGSAS